MAVGRGLFLYLPPRDEHGARALGELRDRGVNLVANALRYTPGGGWIEVRYGAGVVIEVEDSGAGIPAEELPHVFERFYKSRDSGGLGLAIARRLVEAHGGTIRAESEPGRGTRMRIELPG